MVAIVSGPVGLTMDSLMYGGGAAVSLRSRLIAFKQVVEAVHELHHRGYAHNDLKEINFGVFPSLTITDY